jgi:hypothetical protein
VAKIIDIIASTRKLLFFTKPLRLSSIAKIINESISYVHSCTHHFSASTRDNPFMPVINIKLNCDFEILTPCYEISAAKAGYPGHLWPV